MIVAPYKKQPILYLRKKEKGNNSSPSSQNQGICVYGLGGIRNCSAYCIEQLDDMNYKLWNKNLCRPYVYSEYDYVLRIGDLEPSSSTFFEKPAWWANLRPGNYQTAFHQVYYISYYNNIEIFRLYNTQDSSGYFNNIKDRIVRVTQSTPPDNETLQYYKLDTTGVSTMQSLMSAVAPYVPSVMYYDEFVLFTWRTPLVSDEDVLAIMRSIGIANAVSGTTITNINV